MHAKSIWKFINLTLISFLSFLTISQASQEIFEEEKIPNYAPRFISDQGIDHIQIYPNTKKIYVIDLAGKPKEAFLSHYQSSLPWHLPCEKLSAYLDKHYFFLRKSGKDYLLFIAARLLGGGNGGSRDSSGGGDHDCSHDSHIWRDSSGTINMRVHPHSDHSSTHMTSGSTYHGSAGDRDSGSLNVNRGISQTSRAMVSPAVGAPKVYSNPVPVIDPIYVPNTLISETNLSRFFSPNHGCNAMLKVAYQQNPRDQTERFNTTLNLYLVYQQLGLKEQYNNANSEKIKAALSQYTYHVTTNINGDVSLGYATSKLVYPVLLEYLASTTSCFPNTYIEDKLFDPLLQKTLQPWNQYAQVIINPLVYVGREQAYNFLQTKIHPQSLTSQETKQQFQQSLQNSSSTHVLRILSISAGFVFRVMDGIPFTRITQELTDSVFDTLKGSEQALIPGSSYIFTKNHDGAVSLKNPATGLVYPIFEEDRQTETCYLAQLPNEDDLSSPIFSAIGDIFKEQDSQTSFKLLKPAQEMAQNSIKYLLEQKEYNSFSISNYLESTLESQLKDHIQKVFFQNSGFNSEGIVQKIKECTYKICELTKPIIEFTKEIRGLKRSPSCPFHLKDTPLNELNDYKNQIIQKSYDARAKEITMENFAKSTLSIGLDALLITHHILDGASFGTLSTIGNAIDMVAEGARTITRRTVREFTGSQRAGQNWGDAVYTGIHAGTLFIGGATSVQASKAAKIAEKSAISVEKTASLKALDLSTGFKGRSGFELKNTSYQPIRNKPTTINNLDYSGHAIDQMQNRGFFPSVVENTLKEGINIPTHPGTLGYYDPVNNIRIVTNLEKDKIITVLKGQK